MNFITSHHNDNFACVGLPTIVFTLKIEVMELEGTIFTAVTNGGLSLEALLPYIISQYGQDEYTKMQECAEMLEQYVSRFPKEKGCVRFSDPDMERWKNDYFKTLVHGNANLPDDHFYTGEQDTESHYGIGTDGEFTCEELFQFLFRLYKAMSVYKGLFAGEADKMLKTCSFRCAEMLEGYVKYFPKTKGTMELSEEDKKLWKNEYFPNLVEGGPRLTDYDFFKASDKNYGIGADAQFHARELFHFLYRLYKHIYNNSI